MPAHALEVLERQEDARAPDGRICYLRGEALRALQRHAEAIKWLRRASATLPESIHVLVAMAWCHKRTGRIDLAIDDLDRALEIDPGEALLHYNLACYWTLAGNKLFALRYLARAIEMDGRFRDLVGDEPDFDSLRDDPRFQSIVSVIV